MLSNKPYLIRAFYEWIIDSDCTPFLAINATYPKCKVPAEHVVNGEITLNISPTAIRDLNVANDILKFKASFSGIVFEIVVPIPAVLAIYAHENQQGMFFDYEEFIEGDEGDGSTATDILPSTLEKDKRRTHLKLVE